MDASLGPIASPAAPPAPEPTRDPKPDEVPAAEKDPKQPEANAEATVVEPEKAKRPPTPRPVEVVVYYKNGMPIPVRAGPKEPSNTLYIRNLPERTGPSTLLRHLRRMFGSFGTLLDVRLGRGLVKRGQAWIVFSHIDSAKTALQEISLDPSFMGNHRIILQYSRLPSKVIAEREGNLPNLLEAIEKRPAQRIEEARARKKRKAEIAAAAPPPPPPPPPPSMLMQIPVRFPVDPQGMMFHPPPSLGQMPMLPPPGFGAPPQFGGMMMHQQHRPPGMAPGAPLTVLSGAKPLVGDPLKQQPDGAANILHPNAHPSSLAAAVSALTVPEEYIRPSAVLFVTSLPPEANEAQLVEIFRAFPGFLEVRLVPNKRDIAFVEYASDIESSAAKRALNDSQYPGTTHRINVTFRK